MNVLMICDFLNESLSYQENLLAKYYNKLGHRVSIVTTTTDSIFEFVQNRHDASRSASKTELGQTTIYRQPYAFNLLSRIRRFKGVAEILEAEQPDLIFVHDIQFNLPDVLDYKRRHPDTRIVLDYHADYSNSARSRLSLLILHKLLRRPMLRRALPELAAVYPVTPASQRFLHEVYGVPNSSMTLLPLGCDMDECRAVQAAGAGANLRKQHGIASNDFVIFGGGKLARPKRVELLIEAFLNLDRDDAWLVIAGDATADDADYLAALRSQAGSHPRILFTGWLNQCAILGHLDMADVAVFPGSQSILWQQAIGMGKPLVIGEPKAVPGGDQDVGYLNTHNNIKLCIDTASIAVALQDLALNADLRAGMAVGARQAAAALLDWNRIAARTLGD